MHCLVGPWGVLLQELVCKGTTPCFKALFRDDGNEAET